MADETLINVEDDTPAPVAEPVAPAPVAVAPEAPADPDEEAAVEINGTRLVPLPALKAVRDEVKALKARANQADTLAAEVLQLRGQVQAHQQVAAQLRQPQAPAQPAAVVVDERAVKFAQRLDLYRQDASGQAVPDVEKAQELLGIIEQVADQKASQRMAPMATRAAQEASARNYQWALTVKAPNGKNLPQEIVTQIWRAFPPEATADPQIAQTLVYTAAGMDVWRTPAQPAAPAQAPVFTEGVGGNPRSRPVMSQLEQKVAADRGVDAAKWGELTKGHTPGRTVVLED